MNNNYPMLRLIGRHGGWIATVLALLAFAGSVCVVAQGWSYWWLAAGLFAAVLVFGATRSFVELVRVMIDMLLPK
jgi:hypothetical protein